MDIGAWLRALGLGEYEQAFRDNAVDAVVLRALTADDLKDLGVSLVGHRRKLLTAIATLAAGAPAPEARAARARPAPPTAGSATIPRAQGAERRQLTVMFIDLVGSTALASRLDPEEMRDVLHAYQNLVAGEVARFEGHVAKYMGDGVLAYFGWPQAHEDEAERAVRAALAVTEAVVRLATPAGSPLAARVGIATGLVVVGDLVGEAEAREQAVVGETPNLAARLQARASPGEVVVAERTRRLLGGLFELEPVPAAALKGLPEPVLAWRVLGEGEALGRFEALHGVNLTPLVGRGHELGLLLDRWERAKDGEGQVVLLAGEPGIGKSRLVSALRERLAPEPHTALNHFCSPFRQISALHPVIALLERAAGFARDDDPPRKLAKLEALLAQTTADVAGTAPLIAALLSIPTGDHYPPLGLSPQRQKERTLEALLEQLAGLARHRPVLAVYEDVHWADPTTLELLEQVVDRVQALPVLVIVTFRPELAQHWAGHGHVTLLTLSRLGRQESATLVERVADGKTLPAEVLGQIAAKTDGVPLFVEELTKTVLESGLLRDAGDRYVFAGPLPPLAIPSTLHDSLLARLDRLAPVREVAQIGACIGRVFGHELLAAVVPLGEDELRDALAQLCEAELIFGRGTPPDATYSFKHALVQDAAYRSLLRSRRRELHARIAEALKRFPEVLQAQPEVVAQHYAVAGLPAEAMPFWLRAGQHALHRSSMTEAITLLTQGLGSLADLPDGPDRDRMEVEFRLALGNALSAAAGGGTAETVQAYTRVAEICERSGDTSRLVAALYGLITYHFSHADFAAAESLADRALAAADRGDDVPAQAAAHFMVGWVALALGRLSSARTHLEQAIALAAPPRRGPPRDLYGLDLRLVSMVYLAWALCLLGYPERARAMGQEAAAEAERLSQPFTLAVALDRGTAVSLFCRDIGTTAATAARILLIGQEQGFPYYVAKGNFYRGVVMVEEGHRADGIAAMRTALSHLEASRDEEFMPHSLGLLAAAGASARDWAGASSLVRDALDRVRRTGERLFEADLHGLKGRLLAAGAEREAAEACFHRAMAVAREQDARWWELRAATSLARLWAEQGERRKAHGLLAPVYGWFTEGFDTPDLKEAGALLDELRT